MSSQMLSLDDINHRNSLILLNCGSGSANIFQSSSEKRICIDKHVRMSRSLQKSTEVFFFE